MSTSKRWDDSTYEVVLVGGERLIVKSKHGEIIIDQRGKDMNVFHVTPEKKRIELGMFKDGKLV
jgi:hypothetical protein